MADVEVQMQFTTTERKVRKVKKTSKRRESQEGNVESEVTITEIEKENIPGGGSTTETTTTITTSQDQGYVLSYQTIILLSVREIYIKKDGNNRFLSHGFMHGQFPDITIKLNILAGIHKMG
jgi:hypothetical protein